MTVPMTRFAIQRVRATREALDLIERLAEKHGPLAFFQSGESFEGTMAKCLTRAELLPSDDDIKLGEIGGAPFYVDAERYRRSGRPTFLIDVAPGTAAGLPLEGLEEVHFVTRPQDSAAATAQPA
jgi:uncharacterized protein (DUF779 family)